ncbi:hypothetical protein K431DRAFT_211384, partial [Polychaeton citri CBS 116435]
SGAEVIAVLSVISSVIAVIEGSQSLYEAAKNTKGLNEAFLKVAENIPLVLSTLRRIKEVQGSVIENYTNAADATQKADLEESSKAVSSILKICREKARQLEEIIEAVITGDEATRLERYRKALQAAVPGKRRKVEELMRDILDKLQLLHTHHYFQ